MTRFPVHPFTGLVAIGFRRDGRPIYPVRGGSQPTPAPPPGDPAPAPTVPPAPAPAPTPPADPAEPPLGPGGQSALAAEREANRKLRERLGALADTDVTSLVALAKALGGTPSGETETDLQRLTGRMGELEQAAAREREARWRLEVAAEKGLTPAQAERLTGSTREDLAADADALLQLFPTTPAGPPAPRIPAPDPSQGARGPVDIDSLIRDAESKGDVRTAIRLKNQKLHTR
jgi:hypothetical protein